MNATALRRCLVLAFGCSLSGCGQKDQSSVKNAIDVNYTLERRYTGKQSNVLSIDVIEPLDVPYFFSVHSDDAAPDLDGGLHELKSQTITFTYASEGLHSAELKIAKANGESFIDEILPWEYSGSVPDPPIISFALDVTRTRSVNLIVADIRSPSATEIWIGGDVEAQGLAPVENGGQWHDLQAATVSVPVMLAPGDGAKHVEAKLRNIYGTESQDDTADILLKQTAPAGCAAVVTTPIVNDGNVKVQLSGVDASGVYYSVLGDVSSAIGPVRFSNGDTVTIPAKQVIGEKNLNVIISDIAGNVCFDQTLTAMVDPNYMDEVILVHGGVHWTDTEDIVLDIYFAHTPEQEPIQLEITGDVEGEFVNRWFDYQLNVPVTLTPSASGSRTIQARIRDANGVESFVIARRIFLKPSVALADLGNGLSGVIASPIPGIRSMTITGCSEAYDEVQYSAVFDCHQTGTTVEVTYLFTDTTSLTLHN